MVDLSEAEALLCHTNVFVAECSHSSGMRFTGYASNASPRRDGTREKQ